MAQCAESYPVPAGFVITTTAFQRWQTTKITIEPLLHKEIAAAYAEPALRTGTDSPVVAVRSSACGEDSATMSYAGQFQTRLEVQGIEAVVTAIQECWRFADAHSVQAYRGSAPVNGSKWTG